MITEELYIGIWACSCDVHVHGTCWRWSWDVNGMPIKLKEALFVNVNGLASNQSINQCMGTRAAHQELSGEPWSMNTHAYAYPSAPLLFVAGRFGGGIHRILCSPPVAAGWELEIDEGKGGKRLENWEWIIPGSPISPSTTPPQPSPAQPCPPLRGSSLETMPAQGMLFLSLCSPPCWRQARVLGTPPAHAAQPSIPPFLCLQNLRTEAWPSGQVLSVAPLLADPGSNPLGGRFSGRAVRSVGAKKIPLAVLAARLDPLGHGSGFGKFFCSRVASS